VLSRPFRELSRSCLVNGNGHRRNCQRIPLCWQV